nr:MAG TPA: hypothetical protein [Caudoviricetes sp.]
MVPMIDYSFNFILKSIIIRESYKEGEFIL